MGDAGGTINSYLRVGRLAHFCCILGGGGRSPPTRWDSFPNASFYSAGVNRGVGRTRNGPPAFLLRRSLEDAGLLIASECGERWRWNKRFLIRN